MHAMNDCYDGYVKITTNLEDSNKTVVMKNMVVETSSHYGDNEVDVNIEDDKMMMMMTMMMMMMMKIDIVEVQ